MPWAGVAPEIEDRARLGLIVEGHGDLRPEHVWLGLPLQIIDCLEFDRGFRLIDPWDELRYLGLECAVLGADWIGPMLLARLEERLGPPLREEGRVVDQRGHSGAGSYVGAETEFARTVGVGA